VHGNLGLPLVVIKRGFLTTDEMDQQWTLGLQDIIATE
jgi:hypothetical protein